MGHVRDQQREEDMKLLDFLCQTGKLGTGAIQNIIDAVIYPANFHYIDAMGAGRGDLDKLTAYIGAGTMKFMSF